MNRVSENVKRYSKLMEKYFGEVEAFLAKRRLFRRVRNFGVRLLITLH